MPVKIRDFIPPIAAAALDRLRSGSGRKQYATYAQALQDCTAGGYEDADLVRVVVEKTRRYRDDLRAKRAPIQLNATSAYSLCALLASLESDPIHVLDFGGAGGAHYFLARAVLPSSRGLNWQVVETPALAEQAARVLANDELGFSSNLRAAAGALKRIDLLHTSGTLQCVDAPYDYLREIVATSADHLLFNRLGLTRGGHEVVTIHQSWLSWNGPGPMPPGITDRKVRYPFVFPRESVFMDLLSSHYRIVMTFEDTTGIFPVGGEPITGLGLLASRMAGEKRVTEDSNPR